MLEGHGDDRQLYKQQIIADFSTNVWYGPEPVGLKEHIFNKWEVINRYPDVSGDNLSRTISRHHDVKPDNVLVTNGSTESIYLIAEAFFGSKTTIITPTFSEYEDACRRYNHKILFIAKPELDDQQKLQADLIFICNPNNPDGSVFHSIEILLRLNPFTTFIIDEAFIDFTLEIESLVPLIGQYQNLIILRSLTKTWSIPGLRLGYILASKILIEGFKKHKQPWSVNALALEAGEFIFTKPAEAGFSVNSLLADKKRFIVALAKISVKITPGFTHYFLAELKDRTAAELKLFLLENFGILIRDASNFRGLGPRHFRLATLTENKNRLLLNALAEYK